jgi:hypothetical protein
MTAKAHLSTKRSLSNWVKKLLQGNKTRTPYRLTPETIAKLSTDEVQLYLELAEKQLQDSVDTGQIITERSTNLLNLTSALLITLIAYSIGRWETNKTWDLLLCMSVWGSGVLAITSAVLVCAILPNDYCIPGWTPAKIFNSKSFTEGNDATSRQKTLCTNLLMNYENDIQDNRALNKKRWALFNTAMILIVVAPIIFASYYLLFR